MSPASKIVSFESAAKVFETLRQQGKKIVQSHGVFDLIHPGHICHLEEARALGDVLVVSLPADQHVHKGPGRPYFNEHLRLKSLTALACVDYAVLAPHPGAAEVIERIRPHLYCKGKEYEDPDYDTSGTLEEEIRAVELVGGEVRYIGSIKFSSTKLLNSYFDHLSAPVREFCNALAAKYTRRAFSEVIESFAELRILVVGDAIFDRYSSVRVQGLTSKNRILSARFLSQETQCGGALAAFRHVKQFTSHVKLLSLVGTEPWVNPLVREHVTPEEDLIVRDERFTTIVKERFVEPVRAEDELSKLFAVNYLNPDPPPTGVLDQLEARLRAEVARVDAVLLLDFGHGLLQPPLRQLLQETAPFLALNCQTNSYNHGFNIISRQYQRADAFSLDEQELMLSAGQRHIDFEGELSGLKESFGAGYAWLTRGPVETIGLGSGEPPCFCPPLETDVVDTVGAGDAFFSVAGLAAVRRLPIELSTFLGQLAGAQAVKIVGNRKPISKLTLIKGGMSLLNF